MVVVNVGEDIIGIMVDAIDCLLHHYDEYGYKMKDVRRIAETGDYFQERRSQSIDKDHELEQEDLDKPCGKNQHFVVGKGCVDN